MERSLVAAVITMLWDVSIEGYLGVVIAVIILKAFNIDIGYPSNSLYECKRPCFA